MTLNFWIVLWSLFLTRPVEQVNMKAVSPPSVDIVQSLERLILEEARGKVEGVEIQAQDPVRGYMLSDRELILIVPVHHIHSVRSVPGFSGYNADNPLMIQPVTIPNLKEQNKRLQKFQEGQKRRQALKEANFQKMVAEIKRILPRLKRAVSPVAEGFTLHVIVEEREKLWITSGLKNDSQFLRQVVTLKVDNLNSFTGEQEDVSVNRYFRRVEQQEQNSRPF
jgi:hypothetical protein